MHHHSLGNSGKNPETLGKEASVMADSPYIGKIKNGGSQVVKGNVGKASKGKSTVKSGSDLRTGKGK